MMFIQALADEPTLKVGVAADVADKIISQWDTQNGDILDFGGGEKDLFCQDVLAVCDGKPTRLQRMFGLSKAEAKAVIDYCTSPY